ncbi:MAG: hypothetical protein RL708_213 [Bacteroidota bacterium]|jgi:HTH-type transcriptional regulator/antitoxin HigA
MKKQFSIQPITNEAEFANANTMIEELLQYPEGSKEEKILEAITILAVEYEKRNHSIPKANSIDAIKFRMEQLGVKQKDVAKYFGGENRTSEVLRKKRPLTLSMIRLLYKHLQIPAEALIA